MNDIKKSLETLKINKMQAEMLANKTKDHIYKAYCEGYALAMDHAIAVLERGIGPATITDDKIRDEAKAQVKGLDL